MADVASIIKLSTRRDVIESANKLARNPHHVDTYNDHLRHLGQMFTETFGIDCKVTITCDPVQVEERIELLTKEESA